MYHSFDVAVADLVGVNAAVLFQTIAFWCQRCEANESNYYDGNYWTYSSIKAFGDIFSYLTIKQINTALDKLIATGLIIKGNYNKSAYDRTAWYAVTEKGKSIFQKGKMENPKRENPNPEKGKPIPNTITNTVTNTNKGDSVSEGFDGFYKAYPRKVAREAAQRAWAKLKPDEALIQTIIKDIERRKAGEWKGQDIKYIPHPSTYLNQRRWEDEPQGGTVEDTTGRTPYDRMPYSELQRYLTKAQLKILDERHAQGKDAYFAYLRELEAKR